MLELLMLSGSFLIFNEFQCVVGDAWFFSFGWNLRESILGHLFDSLCDGIGLYWGLGVPYFYEVEKKGVVSLVQ